MMPGNQPARESDCDHYTSNWICCCTLHSRSIVDLVSAALTAYTTLHMTD